MSPLSLMITKTQVSYHFLKIKLHQVEMYELKTGLLQDLLQDIKLGECLHINYLISTFPIFFYSYYFSYLFLCIRMELGFSNFQINHLYFHEHTKSRISRKKKLRSFIIKAWVLYQYQQLSPLDTSRGTYGRGFYGRAEIPSSKLFLNFPWT